MRTRIERVSWLGVGLWAAAAAVANAGLSKVSFELTGEDVVPSPENFTVTSAEFQPGSQAGDFSPPSPAMLSIAAEPASDEWLAFAEPARVPLPQTLAAFRADNESPPQPLTVPLPPFGVIGVIGMGTAMSYAGARWLGLRR